MQLYVQVKRYFNWFAQKFDVCTKRKVMKSIITPLTSKKIFPISIFYFFLYRLHSKQEILKVYTILIFKIYSCKYLKIEYLIKKEQ